MGVIRPWLPCNAVLEIASCSADCQVNDQVELLIEGSTFILGSLPRIVPSLEPGSFPVGLIRVVDLEDSVGVSVQVGVQSLVVPVKTEDMEIISE